MKLGAGTYTWDSAHMSLIEALKDISHLDINYVDIWGWGHGNALILKDNEKQDIKFFLDDSGIKVSSILTICNNNLSYLDEKKYIETIDYFKASLEFASMIEAGQILYKAGERVINQPHKTSWNNSVQFTSKVAEMAKSFNIIVTIELEPTPFALVRTIEDMDNFLDDVSMNNVLANIDLGHAALARDGIDEMKKIAQKTIHIHVNDNDTYKHTNDIPGQGIVPIKAYINGLIDGGCEETALKYNQEFVAGIEIEAAKDIQRPMDCILKSKKYLLSNFPQINL